jgi:tetratricopeptide (TPR) repeat protein
MSGQRSNSVSKLALQLNKAIASFQAGQFGEAEKICQKIVATKSNFFDAQYVLAVVLASQGKHDLALTSYNRALTVQPNHPDALSNRGNTYKELGRFDEALASYDRAIALKPDHAGALNNRAVVLQVLQRHDEALASLDRALALQPNFADALTNRGITLNALGRFDEALASYDRVLSLQPNALAALCNRGNTLRTMRRFDEALASYDRAIALLPNFSEAHANRAILLAQLARYDEALAALERLLTLRPNDAEGYNNRGVVLVEMKRYAEALANYDRALSLSPDYTDAIYNRGNALHELGRYDEALACYDRVLQARPDDGNALNNRGKALKELNRYDEALACSARALAALPDNVVAHCNEASMRLLIGDLPRGFAEYEWRWKKADMAPAKREFPQPLWLGAEDISGKTILLHGEQGFGDAIQFCRYVPLVAARGARVILEVRPALVALMQGLAGASAVIAKGDALPAFDLHCSLLSLPLAMGTTLETVPAQVPYLHASPGKCEEWSARLGAKTKPRVGLCWAGNATHERDRDRSMRLSDYGPLLDLDATFVSLHQEVRAEDAAVLAARPDIVHFGEALKDFTDTAALVAALDLVISVDTSVAHLAGALAKPTWVMITYVPEWRWLLTREDSPWYPSVRLFRQDVGRAWSGVVARVRAAGREFIQSPQYNPSSPGLSR